MEISSYRLQKVDFLLEQIDRLTIPTKQLLANPQNQTKNSADQQNHSQVEQKQEEVAEKLKEVKDEKFEEHLQILKRASNANPYKSPPRRNKKQQDFDDTDSENEEIDIPKTILNVGYNFAPKKTVNKRIPITPSIPINNARQKSDLPLSKEKDIFQNVRDAMNMQDSDKIEPKSPPRPKVAQKGENPEGPKKLAERLKNERLQKQQEKNRASARRKPPKIEYSDDSSDNIRKVSNEAKNTADEDSEEEFQVIPSTNLKIEKPKNNQIIPAKKELGYYDIHKRQQDIKGIAAKKITRIEPKKQKEKEIPKPIPKAPQFEDSSESEEEEEEMQVIPSKPRISRIPIRNSSPKSLKPSQNKSNSPINNKKLDDDIHISDNQSNESEDLLKSSQIHENIEEESDIEFPIQFDKNKNISKDSDSNSENNLSNNNLYEYSDYSNVSPVFNKNSKIEDSKFATNSSKSSTKSSAIPHEILKKSNIPEQKQFQSDYSDLYSDNEDVHDNKAPDDHNNENINSNPIHQQSKDNDEKEYSYDDSYNDSASEMEGETLNEENFQSTTKVTDENNNSLSLMSSFNPNRTKTTEISRKSLQSFIETELKAMKEIEEEQMKQSMKSNQERNTSTQKSVPSSSYFYTYGEEEEEESPKMEVSTSFIPNQNEKKYKPPVVPIFNKILNTMNKADEKSLNDSNHQVLSDDEFNNSKSATNKSGELLNNDKDSVISKNSTDKSRKSAKSNKSTINDKVDDDSLQLSFKSTKSSVNNDKDSVISKNATDKSKSDKDSVISKNATSKSSETRNSVKSTINDKDSVLSDDDTLQLSFKSTKSSVNDEKNSTNKSKSDKESISKNATDKSRKSAISSKSTINDKDSVLSDDDTLQLSFTSTVNNEKDSIISKNATDKSKNDKDSVISKTLTNKSKASSVRSSNNDNNSVISKNATDKSRKSTVSDKLANNDEGSVLSDEEATNKSKSDKSSIVSENITDKSRKSTINDKDSVLSDDEGLQLSFKSTKSSINDHKDSVISMKSTDKSKEVRDSAKSLIGDKDERSSKGTLRSSIKSTKDSTLLQNDSTIKSMKSTTDETKDKSRISNKSLDLSVNSSTLSKDGELQLSVKSVKEDASRISTKSHKSNKSNNSTLYENEGLKLSMKSVNASPINNSSMSKGEKLSFSVKSQSNNSDINSSLQEDGGLDLSMKSVKEDNSRTSTKSQMQNTNVSSLSDAEGLQLSMKSVKEDQSRSSQMQNTNNSTLSEDEKLDLSVKSSTSSQNMSKDDPMRLSVKSLTDQEKSIISTKSLKKNNSTISEDGALRLSVNSDNSKISALRNSSTNKKTQSMKQSLEQSSNLLQSPDKSMDKVDISFSDVDDNNSLLETKNSSAPIKQIVQQDDEKKLDLSLSSSMEENNDDNDLSFTETGESGKSKSSKDPLLDVSANLFSTLNDTSASNTPPLKSTPLMSSQVDKDELLPSSTKDGSSKTSISDETQQQVTQKMKINESLFTSSSTMQSSLSKQLNEDSVTMESTIGELKTRPFSRISQTVHEDSTLSADGTYTQQQATPKMKTKESLFSSSKIDNDDSSTMQNSLPIQLNEESLTMESTIDELKTKPFSRISQTIHETSTLNEDEENNSTDSFDFDTTDLKTKKPSDSNSKKQSETFDLRTKKPSDSNSIKQTETFDLKTKKPNDSNSIKQTETFDLRTKKPSDSNSIKQTETFDLRTKRPSDSFDLNTKKQKDSESMKQTEDNDLRTSRQLSDIKNQSEIAGIMAIDSESSMKQSSGTYTGIQSEVLVQESLSPGSGNFNKYSDNAEYESSPNKQKSTSSSLSKSANLDPRLSYSSTNHGIKPLIPEDKSIMTPKESLFETSQTESVSKLPIFTPNFVDKSDIFNKSDDVVMNSSELGYTKTYDRTNEKSSSSKIEPVSDDESSLSKPINLSVLQETNIDESDDAFSPQPLIQESVSSKSNSSHKGIEESLFSSNEEEDDEDDDEFSRPINLSKINESQLSFANSTADNDDLLSSSLNSSTAGEVKTKKLFISPRTKNFERTETLSSSTVKETGEFTTLPELHISTELMKPPNQKKNDDKGLTFEESTVGNTLTDKSHGQSGALFSSLGQSDSVVSDYIPHETQPSPRINTKAPIQSAFDESIKSETSNSTMNNTKNSTNKLRVSFSPDVMAPFIKSANNSSKIAKHNEEDSDNDYESSNIVSPMDQLEKYSKEHSELSRVSGGSLSHSTTMAPLSIEEENVLRMILPRAVNMQTPEIYSAVAREMNLPRNNPSVTNIVANICKYLGIDTEKSNPLEVTQSLPEISDVAEESSDDYF